jgi:hypothetical protein
MNYKYRLITGVFSIIIGILLIGASILFTAATLTLIGILFLVVSLVYTLFVYSIEIFIKDKELDIEELKKQGLTVVICENCRRNNVIEDIYCIYCGERLEIIENNKYDS